jgi:hypothetical protein
MNRWEPSQVQHRWLHSARPRAAALLLCVLAVGCGTTRFTDTARTATEMLLISKAVDDTLASIDFHPLAGKTVFLEEKYLEGVQDRQYLISSLRQHLLASGALLQEERGKATYIVEPRAGAIATDNSSLLVGIPAIVLPTYTASPVPIPSSIPEIPFAKSTDQRAYAKIAVFAYNRLTGRPVLQSGIVQARADAKDLWVMGMGPFRSGSIRPKTELSGAVVSLPFFGGAEEDEGIAAIIDVTQPAWWSESGASAAATRDVKRATPTESGFAAERGSPSADAGRTPESMQSPVLPASLFQRNWP